MATRRDQHLDGGDQERPVADAWIQQTRVREVGERCPADALEHRSGCAILRVDAAARVQCIDLCPGNRRRVAVGACRRQTVAFGHVC